MYMLCITVECYCYYRWYEIILNIGIIKIPTCLSVYVMVCEHNWQSVSRVSILTSDIDTGNLSVCLSVRNVPVSDENDLTYRHSFFTLRYIAQSF